MKRLDIVLLEIQIRYYNLMNNFEFHAYNNQHDEIYCTHAV